jgi:hypothetical protein
MDGLFPKLCLVVPPSDQDGCKTKVKRQIKTLLLYHFSFLHALMKFKDIDQIKVAISETL